jgi:hypothetical protein
MPADVRNAIFIGEPEGNRPVVRHGRKRNGLIPCMRCFIGMCGTLLVICSLRVHVTEVYVVEDVGFLRLHGFTAWKTTAPERHV